MRGDVFDIRGQVIYNADGVETAGYWGSCFLCCAWLFDLPGGLSPA
jgi:hypothetical protein